jgi:hypothetical protein
MSNEQPSWLAALDAQIQRSKGSTKRQLQTLRERQLAKANGTQTDNPEQLLRDTLKVLTTPHFDIDETHLIARIKAALDQ